MKVRFLLLFCVWSSVNSEPRQLPPVVDNATYPAASATNSTPSTSTKTLYEMMGRLEQLQVEVQQLTGKVEEQTYQINELKKRQNTMYTDFDERMQGIEAKGANPASDDENPDKPVAPPPSGSNPPAPAAVSAPAAPAAALATAASSASETVKKPEAAPQASSDEKSEYQHAYDALRNGHTSLSINEFVAFLKKYPAAALANNAQYWLGEAYRVNQDMDSARNAFKKVIENYPGGTKVPDAIFKLGAIELELNNSAKAREYFNRVTTEYPDTAAAHLAAKKLNSIDETVN